MERDCIAKLFQWKQRVNRKPLIVRGARQVGKTWLIMEFARQAYPKHVYVNFEQDQVLNHIFESTLDPQKIIAAISIRLQTEIDADTLIIFDEIQAARGGVTALKYFCESAPQYHVIAVGSLLGVAMHHGDSFPVGKVEFVDLYPLSFREFLMACGEECTVQLIEAKDWDTVSLMRDHIIERLRTYYFVGGMPEAVACYCQSGDMAQVQAIQRNILDTYENDFSKHAPAIEVPRIRMVWHSVIGQLAKENRKFIYGMLRQGARAKDFELALQWLADAGLIYKVHRCKKADLPLKAYEDFSAFKVYMLDVGLMCAAGGLTAESLLRGNELFNSFRGALTEQYVCQQMQGCADAVYYWSAENSSGEIDFLVQSNGHIHPIEVKAEENLRAKSLSAFVAANPALHGWRLSMSDHRRQQWMTNFPLYTLFTLLPS
ncbi:MAG: ATP-binding protein [Muribaculaceae bacterium]